MVVNQKMNSWNPIPITTSLGKQLLNKYIPNPKSTTTVVNPEKDSSDIVAKSTPQASGLSQIMNGFNFKINNTPGLDEEKKTEIKNLMVNKLGQFSGRLDEKAVQDFTNYYDSLIKVSPSIENPTITDIITKATTSTNTNSTVTTPTTTTPKVTTPKVTTPKVTTTPVIAPSVMTPTQQPTSKNLKVDLIVNNGLTDDQKNTLKTIRDKYKSDDDILTFYRNKYKENSDEYKIMKETLARNPREQIISDLGIDANKIYGDKLNESDTAKINILTQDKIDNLERIKKDYESQLFVLSKGNERLRNLYGINEDGTPDYKNKNGMAFQIKDAQDKYEKTKNDTFSKYESGRRSQVTGQIRSALASRGIDISKIPMEQLLGLSGVIGQKAFSDIYTAKAELDNVLYTSTQNAMNQINKLRETGVINLNDYEKNIELLRSKYQADASLLNKDYINTIFGIGDTATTREDTKKQNAVTSIVSLGASLGLDATGLGALSDIIKNSPDIITGYQNVLNAMNDQNSALFKEFARIKASAEEIASFKNETDRLKTQASLISASKSSSGSTLSDRVKTVGGILGFGEADLDSNDKIMKMYGDIATSKTRNILADDGKTLLTTILGKTIPQSMVDNASNILNTGPYGAGSSDIITTNKDETVTE